MGAKWAVYIHPFAHPYSQNQNPAPSNPSPSLFTLQKRLDLKNHDFLSSSLARPRPRPLASDLLLSPRARPRPPASNLLSLSSSTFDHLSPLIFSPSRPRSLLLPFDLLLSLIPNPQIKRSSHVRSAVVATIHLNHISLH